jgi:hypothetical protein
VITTTPKPGWRARFAQRDRLALVWLATAVDAWEAEARVTADEAAAMRAKLATPDLLAVLPHLGAHLAISTVLPFPFASLMRAGWTFWMLLVASLRLLARRLDRASWRRAWGIHHPLVILLALVPALGVGAYFLSAPLRTSHLLARAALDAAGARAPWRLYERCGLRRLVVAGRAGGSRGA